jgi:hypothetical protein
MKTYGYFAAAFLASVFSFVTAGCFSHSFKTKPVTPASSYPDAIEQAKKDQRYFLLKSGINLYTVTSVDLDKAKQQITVTLDKVDSSHLANVKNFESKHYKLRKGDTPASSAIHIYMTDSTSYTLDEPHTIPMDKVGRVELLD